jgi:hypothetical protein
MFAVVATGADNFTRSQIDEARGVASSARLTKNSQGSADYLTSRSFDHKGAESSDIASISAGSFTIWRKGAFGDHPGASLVWTNPKKPWLRNSLAQRYNSEQRLSSGSEGGCCTLIDGKLAKE